MADKLVEPKTIAKIFNFEGVRRIDQLVQDGVIDATLTEVNGRKVRRYDLIPTIMKYIKYLQDKLNKKSKPISLEDAAEDEARRLKAEADLKEAKAAIENLKKEEFEATMHRSEDVETVMEMLVMAFRAEALAIPGQVAVDVAEATTAQEASGIIKNAVNNMLNRLSEFKYDPAKFKKLVREREKWMNERMEEGADEGSGGEAKPRNNKGVRKPKGT